MAVVDEYKARILSYVEGKDPVSVQRETPRALAQIVSSTPENELLVRPAPNKWSVGEVLAHFAEGEVVSSWRYRQIIEHDGGPLSPYDQDLWNSLGDYASWQPQDSLTQFTLLRQANLRLFDRVTPAQWERRGIHAERGPLTLRDLAALIAGHDLNHLMQIKAILER